MLHPVINQSETAQLHTLARVLKICFSKQEAVNNIGADLTPHSTLPSAILATS